VRISEALAERKPLSVKFTGGAVLSIEYYPPAWTVAELEENQADKNPARIIAMMQKLLASWDLDDDSGEPIDIQNLEAMKHVPTSVFGEISKAIREDQSPPGEA
jgi:hypothetical protein